MAATLTLDNQPDGRRVADGRKLRVGSGNLGTSYATNGVAITPQMLELNVITDMDIRPAGGHVFEWDKTNSKIKAYRQKDPAAAGGADIPLPEVAAATNLSAIPFRFRVTGY